MLWWNSQKNQKNLFIRNHLNQSLPHQSFRRSGIHQLRVDLMHCGRCYEDSMTESLWCDHNKEMRADVLTSPEFSLSRGGEEDTRRKYNHTATFQPSRENQALPHVSWSTFSPNSEGFCIPATRSQHHCTKLSCSTTVHSYSVTCNSDKKHWLLCLCFIEHKRESTDNQR